MVCGFVKFGGIARVVGVVGATAPVVACRRDFQLGGLRVLAERITHCGHGLLVGVIAESVGAKPNLIHVGVEVFGRAFGETEG